MLEDLAHMIKQCRDVRSTDEMSILVAPDSGLQLMREAMMSRGTKITWTDDPDELFIYDGVPIRVRVCVSPGIASIYKEVPERSCCDKTAMVVMAIALSKGRG